MAAARKPNQQFMFGEVPSPNTAIIQAMSFDEWDRKSEFKIAEFLALGFYYVTTGVRCSQCGHIQTEWSSDKNLLVQHCNFNPRCPLVQDFYHNPIINYYFNDSPIMHDIHVALIHDTIRSFPSQ
jgi:hypothetical protein